MGAGAATSTTAAVVGGTTIAAAGSAAYSVNQSSQAAKAAKLAAGEADARQQKMVRDLQAAQAGASSQAQAAIDERRRRMQGSQTIFTNPLGLGEVASTAKKSLLGL
jgi:hypothetical protein